MEKEKFKIALCGNPNVGKSTVFNSLTGLKQHTGNWTGKTVDLASGEFSYQNKDYIIYDLPGTYSLLSHSREEEVARDFICFEDVDLTIVVCDAVCLERNLSLVLQILEIEKNVIVCVNLMDEAKKKKIAVNLDMLSEQLKVPVVGISARNKGEIKKLLEAIDQFSNNQIHSSEFKITYPSLVEETVKKLENLFEEKMPIHFKRWLSLKLLDDDFDLIDKIIEKYKIDKYAYLSLKEELIECGYPTDVIRDLYTSSFALESERICTTVIQFQNPDYVKKNQKLDKILTNKITGIPIMIFFLFILFWITIVGANYPSMWLSTLFSKGEDILENVFFYFKIPDIYGSLLIHGVYKVVTWIISVMLPPMAIFFPLFTLLEDLGFLPRIAFNLDYCFQKCKTCGKQALTMMMGFGCNAAGVTGCRIIDSKRERLVAILTNNFVPCNGRFPTIISILTIFFVGYTSYASSFKTAVFLLLIILLGIFMTFLVSHFLSRTLLKGMPSSFILELPPYRKPQVGKVIIRSLLDRTLYVLGRALKIAVPAGFIIWMMANVYIDGDSLLSICANILNPLGEIMGLDGVILIAFLLGFPANEIVVPIMIMAYMKLGVLTDTSSLLELRMILLENGWTIETALCFIIFMLFHFPCSTTLLTIKKETGSWKWTLFAFFLPTIIGMLFCILIHSFFLLFL
jgi:ferrous iron transport protein B